MKQMIARKLIAPISAICFSLGAWQLGEGVYLEAKAWLAQLLLQQAWSETLSGQSQVKPWPWADTWPMARIQVKRLGVDRIVLSDASGRSMAFGPGYVSGTTEFGRGGNSAISGHRDTHFRFLKNLQLGDQIELTMRDGKVRSYRITNASVQHQNDTWLLADNGDEQLTLITCYPFNSLTPGGPLRYVVQAKTVVF
jgi:sortase A